MTVNVEKLGEVAKSLAEAKVGKNTKVVLIAITNSLEGVGKMKAKTLAKNTIAGIAVASANVDGIEKTAKKLAVVKDGA